jgi:hypothetical protein
MAVDEIKKERGVWCAHAGHAGCHIYETRPGACRDFNCRWLADSRFGEWWYPQKSKIVVDAQIDETGMTVSFHVDPKYPGRWREDPYFRDIKAIAAAGLKQKPGWLTVVVVGRRVIPFAD